MNLYELKYTRIIWLSMIILIIVLALISPLKPNYEIVSFFGVFTHSIVVLLILLTFPEHIRKIFIWAFIIRVLFMIWDLYAREIFKFPNSGADTEMYYGASVRISENIELLGVPHRGGVYVKFLASLFYIICPARMISQYLNVLIGLFVVITVYKILLVNETAPQIAKTIVFIAAFFPNSLIMSAILLREIIPTFFVAVSI